MANLRSGLVLNEGENLVMELEAELWASSSNFIAKIIGGIIKLINLILGNKREGFVVITDKRVVEIVQFKALWVFNVGKNVKFLLPSSVKEVGYFKEGTFCGCFCQSYNLYYDAFTQRTSVLLSSVDSDAEAQKVVEAFYNAISAAQ
ncbi:hypothetical protein H6A66_01905 [Bacteroides caecigallinarum]|uniref:hypothetical protein n=1 Tax=Bacteroides caecigallinarum TaxID=1411144 RepID=UPI00195D5435|nr:hypothetical protein [Bacteroides caecigallinarum]MBM6863944.1 hypothetical protein [Bacteroides caecigallinarum]